MQSSVELMQEIILGPRKQILPEAVLRKGAKDGLHPVYARARKRVSSSSIPT
jgi:hypothetical protein